MRERISYLGHVISANGIETDQPKTEVLRTWPIPTSVADVRKCIGFSGYFRRFIKDFSKLAKPLSDLLIGHSDKKKGKSGLKAQKVERH